MQGHGTPANESDKERNTNVLRKTLGVSGRAAGVLGNTEH